MFHPLESSTTTWEAQASQVAWHQRLQDRRTEISIGGSQTVAAGLRQCARLIDYQRGHMHSLERSRLEEAGASGLLAIAHHHRTHWVRLADASHLSMTFNRRRKRNRHG